MRLCGCVGDVVGDVVGAWETFWVGVRCYGWV